MKQITYLIIFFLSAEIYGLTIGGPGVTKIKRASKRSPSLVSATGVGTEDMVQQPQEEVICRSKQENISLSYLTFLSRQNPPIKLLKIEGTKIKISVSSHLSDCLKIDISASVLEHPQLVRLSIKNKMSINETFADTDSEELNELAMDEKILRCLKAKNLISCDDSDRCTQPKGSLSRPKTMTFDLKHQFDPKKPVSLVFGSPHSSDFVLHSRVGTNSDCWNDEEITKDGVKIISEEEANANRVMQLCESGDLSEIQSELSNGAVSTELRTLLSGALRRSQEDFAKEKFRRLEELRSEIKESNDEDELRQLGREYSQILESLEEELINPSIVELETLMKQRSSARDRQERRLLDEEIERISKLVGSYAASRNERIFESAALIDKFLKFGYDNYANDIAEFKLKSRYFSKVRPRGGISISAANSRVKRDFKKFQRRSKEARILYFQKTGVTQLSPKVKSSIRVLKAKRDADYRLAMQTIKGELQNCQRVILGFMRNPVRCQKAMRSQQTWLRQAMSRRATYNRRIGKLTRKYQRYAQLEAKAKEAYASEDDSMGEGFLGSYELLGSADPASGNPYSMINPVFPQQRMNNPMMMRQMSPMMNPMMMGQMNPMMGQMNPMMMGMPPMMGGYPRVMY